MQKTIDLNKKSKIEIWTDGACKGNPGPGGWGCLIISDGDTQKLWGGDSSTTNNRMELTAAIKALQNIEPNSIVTLYTDSNYVKDGLTKWLAGWKKNGWRTSSKKPVKNKDLWLELEDCTAQHKVTWKWVKGHSGDPNNEMADNLANLGLLRAN